MTTPPVELTEPERESLDVMGMFPTSGGLARPADWERDVTGRLVSRIEGIVAARMADAWDAAIRQQNAASQRVQFNPYRAIEHEGAPAMSESAELTESEKADLIDAFQDGYLMSTDPKTSDLTQLGIVATRIKAAARREALLEAADAMESADPEDVRHAGCDPQYAWKGWSDASLFDHMQAVSLWAPWLRDRAAALAEPERDEGEHERLHAT